MCYFHELTHSLFLAMHSVGYPRSQCSSPSPEDILVKKILLTHDPDGRRVDSELLLRMMENVMYYATTSNVCGLDLPDSAIENLCNTGVVGSHESLGNTIYRISHEILCKCSGEGDLQERLLAVFELLGSYSWDAKLVLVLVAFATNYGEFWLIMQLCPLNPLAVSVAMLKQLPSDLGAFKRRFKALTSLVKTMLEVTKCVIEFEDLPLQHVELEEETMIATMSPIYIAAYWVIRSALICSSQITDMVAAKHEQEHSTSTAIATWELSSLVCWVSHIHDNLRRQVDLCHNQIEAKLDRKLSDLFKKTHVDNQEILQMLFALEDDFPLKQGYAQAKVKVSELIKKEVILLVSKPKIGSLEDLLLLVQQTYDHPQQNEFERQYEIIWVPIPCSSRWSDVEEKEYHQLSNALPMYSICKPWRLSTAIVNYIRREWHFMEEPLMVVLDRQGRVSSSNAMDMIWIWGGPKAYPFSVARELQLWEEASWSLQLLVNEINPLVSYWVEERRTLCLYGSDDLEWINEFTLLMKEIRSAGVQLELVYVGKKEFDEHVRDILDTIAEGKLGLSLSYLKMQFFWLRLESMKRSKLRLGRTNDGDIVLKEVASLLSPNASVDGWAVMGEGSSTDVIKFGGKQFIECLKLFQCWGNDIEKLGLLGAIRNALEPPPPALKYSCNHSSVIPYVEGLLTQGTQVCKECKRPMEKHILYQCIVTEELNLRM
ncbi:protein SIEVE ELEMENT OCCLUSION C [Telopea speciosissima]|uniref:protein SIEVE ELEMENT OCCLUSION C n=1 Tax=Telopea speciosissima TaxID=54955 RepID=UPI001CC6351C|nr:protein SIEVE ELEMENT OCCLUSION C [Telopea speciosissima]